MNDRPPDNSASETVMGQAWQQDPGGSKQMIVNMQKYHRSMDKNLSVLHSMLPTTMTPEQENALTEILIKVQR